MCCGGYASLSNILDKMMGDLSTILDKLESFAICSAEGRWLRDSCAGSPKAISASSASLSESANPREVGNLVKLAKIDENVRRFIMVTKEEEDTVEKDDVSIEIIPAWKFLLDLAARDDS